ncbi:hypothetical protein A3B21_02540 [Candidatus Uhrbacteria bacterium RIFCSPLOWO2_01_FULL_47_24]|uniref:Type II secretion system protein J n=1 Tax=Candidatus Uhrbacteria bacterium RIFCSPLOWO2_01_FULL_47_24 TaxID=1802401 RepID=A0A1F7UP20_9BACT|nr:MAG: hypothetical protein A2753_02300 [Candidatus Uhrbacteria bacterium RIFCSPHIGHO2_01_FULL_47_11]OGL68283.1 MAG: hypothetical protein A3D58_04760 [Candidatus Uhrbacteria bacterium RIFCSPHIGHO2_02_FULL_46_47]OGL75695.1 MAG: hypothetical protein A3F52_01770 [Candidatus Uhrbacteria bacterium RIFCSPHIGHO2_12_FULL_47_11]OGL80021.1 MAG: hypothetical protein A3B21_02540 [Candidatus Uhrbacteria bacterium RIFCSPLOWO2_01_FULL_47_24]OGL85219.1 MAG: hypothetical protein A3J03_00130 [Candidatus Uhrbact
MKKGIARLIPTAVGMGGFTIIEVFISVAAATLIFAALLNIVLISQKTFTRLSDRAEIVQNGRVALERISRELRQADALVTTLPSFEIKFQDGHEPLTLNYIRYYLQDGALYRELSYYSFPNAPSVHVRAADTDPDGNPPQINILDNEIMAEYITTMQFSETPIITIELTLIKGAVTSSIETAIYARNVHAL